MVYTIEDTFSFNDSIITIGSSVTVEYSTYFFSIFPTFKVFRSVNVTFKLGSGIIWHSISSIPPDLTFVSPYMTKCAPSFFPRNFASFMFCIGGRSNLLTFIPKFVLVSIFCLKSSAIGMLCPKFPELSMK